MLGLVLFSIEVYMDVYFYKNACRFACVLKDGYNLSMTKVKCTISLITLVELIGCLNLYILDPLANVLFKDDMNGLCNFTANFSLLIQVLGPFLVSMFLVVSIYFISKP